MAADSYSPVASAPPSAAFSSSEAPPWWPHPLHHIHTEDWQQMSWVEVEKQKDGVNSGKLDESFHLPWRP